MKNKLPIALCTSFALISCVPGRKNEPLPNIVIIYADDLGYGDISCYGATKLITPNIDILANQGLKFTNAHCTSATSTPSRYSLLTGEYAWRRKGTNVARGDAILEFDWSVGEIVKTIDNLKLTEKTIIIVTSDNGPVVDDGYKDQAVEKLDGYTPAGPLRGGKYSAFDGGTRVAFIVRCSGKIKPGTSDALVSQVDFLSSFASMTGQKLSYDAAPDSFDQLNVLLGKSKIGREWIVEHAVNGRLSIIKGEWKFIEPGQGEKLMVNTNTETGNDPLPQLYNIKTDLGEKINVAPQNQVIVKELTDLLIKQL